MVEVSFDHGSSLPEGCTAWFDDIGNAGRFSLVCKAMASLEATALLKGQPVTMETYANAVLISQLHSEGHIGVHPSAGSYFGAIRLYVMVGSGEQPIADADNTKIITDLARFIYKSRQGAKPFFLARALREELGAFPGLRFRDNSLEGIIMRVQADDKRPARVAGFNGKFRIV